MKKITSFLTLALLLGGVSTAKADVVPELQGAQKVTVLDYDGPVQSVEDLTIGEGWYVLSQSRGEEGFMFDVDTLSEGSVLRYKRSVIYDEENTFTSKFGPALVRFEEGSTPGTYRIMFGTGRYLSQLENETASSQRLTAGDEADAADMFVYVTETDGTVNYGCFALNFVNSAGEYGLRVDTNDHVGEKATVVTWDTGLNTNASGNNIWTIYAVEFEESGELEVALGEFKAILREYEAKTSTFTNKVSTDGTPGTYSTELVEAFNAAITEGYNVEYEWESYTVEEIQAAGQAIIDAYNAAIASYVNSAMNVEPGYYFIATHKIFRKTITPETPEGEEPAEPYTIVMNKFMYSDNQPAGIQAKWGTIAEDETKAIYLWKITKDSDKKYLVKNVGTDAGFCQAMPAMSVESDSLIQFDYMTKKAAAAGSEESDTIFYTLRHVREAGNIGNSFHANGHGSGAGTGGTVIKWNGEAEASQWALIPVSEADAQAMIDAYADTKANVALQNEARRIISDVEVKMMIADEKIPGDVDYDAPLILEASQLSSPYGETQAAENSSLEHLLDNNNETYWHSTWSGADKAIATGHYLQVQLTNPDEVSDVSLVIRRRHNANNDHPTKFSVYGTENPDAAKSACTLLGVLDVPFSGKGEVDTTDVVSTGHMPYLRFYATDCTGSEVGFRTYWHAAAFQLFPATSMDKPNSQAKGMGEIFTNMQAAYKDAMADGDTITAEHCNALIAAYKEFNARFVNPDTLRNAIADNKNVPAYAVQGDQPGFWSDANAGQDLTKAIADATAYDEAGVLYPETSANHVKAIEAAKKAMFEAANKVKTGKWYNFRFATEQMYDDNNWSKTGADAHRYSLEDGDNQDGDHWPSLYGKLVSLGKEQTADSDTNFIYVPVTEDDTVALGNRLYLLDEVEITPEIADHAMFRFISVADTAYIIQNKATGLYLRAAGGSGAVTLSIQPTLWKNSAMGYGKVMSMGNDLLGNNNNPLHTQRDGNFLVTWNATGVSSNTGFLIEEVENVADDYAKNDFQMVLNDNAIYSFCYPMDVTPAEGQSVYGVSVKGAEITLTVYKDNVAPAGSPFIYITGTDEYVEDAEPVLHNFTYSGELNAVADTIGAVHGSYFSTTAPKGSIIATGEGAFKAVRSNTNIGWNSAWINAQLEDPKNAEITVTMAEGVFDSIKDAVVNANKDGKIYSIDGTYVGKGNINTVKGLKKGLYIVNGVKVLVK